jgi:hypothetical protein
MTRRIVTKPFYATRLDRDDDRSCIQLEGCDITGDVPFAKDTGPLEDGFPPKGQFVNCQPVVQFRFQSYSYCAERTVYEGSTEEIKNPLNEKSA